MRYSLIILLMLPFWIQAQTHAKLAWTDSVKITDSYISGMPILGSDFEKGWLLSRQKISSFGLEKQTNIDLTEQSKHASARAGIQVGSDFYILDYPFRILKVNPQTGVQKRFKLNMVYKGVDYDIHTPTVNSGKYLSSIDAFLFYVIPVGIKKENLYNSEKVYTDHGYIGIFKIKKSKVILSAVLGRRDKVYAEKAVLPYLHQAYIDVDTSSESLYVAQCATPYIQQMSTTGNVLQVFGEKGKLITNDAIHSILPGQYTKRRFKCYAMCATLYQDIHVDAASQRLFRMYRIGVNVEMSEDSLAAPSPPVPKGACGAPDPYIDFIYKKRGKAKQGLQIYDLSTSPPALLYDLPFTGKYEVLGVEGDEIIFAGRKKTGFCLYKARVKEMAKPERK